MGQLALHELQGGVGSLDEEIAAAQAQADAELNQMFTSLVQRRQQDLLAKRQGRIDALKAKLAKNAPPPPPPPPPGLPWGKILGVAVLAGVVGGWLKKRKR